MLCFGKIASELQYHQVSSKELDGRAVLAARDLLLFFTYYFMHSTFLRREAIHGLLVGTACGEAIGLQPTPACPRMRLRVAKDRQGSVWSRAGFYGVDTQLMLLSAQSVLNSCSVYDGFQHAFLRRLAWYQLSFPVGMSVATRWAATIGWFRRFGVRTGFCSAENSPLSRATFVALALNGTGHNLSRWIERSTKLTHVHPKTSEACLVLANLIRLCANAKGNLLDPIDILKRLAAISTQESLKDKLDVLAEQVEKHRSPRAVARHLGWERRLPKNSEATLVMACYCFLRYPTDYFRAVNSASLIGGDRSTLCALVGGLVGAHLGYQSLPERVKQYSFPLLHGQNWMAEMSERFSHWPHGAEDLNWAPSLKSRPLLQLIRNLSQQLYRLVSFIMRLPVTIMSLVFC